MKKDFGSLGLDAQVLQGVKKKGYKHPTKVQSECIPALLSGKDVVALAKTGTGKTMAYLLPLVNKLVAGEGSLKSWQALILVPTRELCKQVCEEAEDIIKHCNAGIKATHLNLRGTENPREVVKVAGHIVVATPGQVSALVQSDAVKNDFLSENLSMLVVDEADLILSYGYEEDFEQLAPKIPRSCQSVLVTATTEEEMSRLTGLLLHNPLTIDLLQRNSEEDVGPSGGDSGSIDHFLIESSEEDRLVHLLVLLRLKLVQRRVLIFLNSTFWAYKAKLFLERFGIGGVVLHAQLPLNSRHHIIKQFNMGLFQYLLVADDTHAPQCESEHQQKKRKTESSGNAPKKAKKDEEFGVTRGLDFQGVATVINAELPDSVEGYIHRVGRTGRAGASGTAITLLEPSNGDFKKNVEEALRSRMGLDEDDDVLLPYKKMHRQYVEAMRLRAEDILRGITKNVVKEARLQDLKRELVNSEALGRHFAMHPRDLAVLKQEKSLVSQRDYTHLKTLPSYIVAPSKSNGRRLTLKQVAPIKGYKTDPLKVDLFKWKPIMGRSKTGAGAKQTAHGGGGKPGSHSKMQKKRRR